jgi:hypothetical protein
MIFPMSDKRFPLSCMNQKSFPYGPKQCSIVLITIHKSVNLQLVSDKFIARGLVTERIFSLVSLIVTLASS